MVDQRHSKQQLPQQEERKYDDGEQPETDTNQKACGGLRRIRK
jgi:hypothetical protein